MNELRNEWVSWPRKPLETGASRVSERCGGGSFPNPQPVSSLGFNLTRMGKAQKWPWDLFTLVSIQAYLPSLLHNHIHPSLFRTAAGQVIMKGMLFLSSSLDQRSYEGHICAAPWSAEAAMEKGRIRRTEAERMNHLGFSPQWAQDGI